VVEDGRRYRLLGGLEVLEEPGRLDLGTRKQRAVLAVLLLAEGRAVSSDTLTEALWGDVPPDRADASLQAYVSNLRRVLEPDRAPRAPATVLVTRGGGYALDAGREQVDALRFADQVTGARDRQAAGDLRGAATALRNALAGYAPLLPEFDGESWRQPAAEHLDGVHAAALELSYEIRLGLGEHRLLLADLEAAVRRHPLNENFWAMLALARYRLGRQGDALRAIADARRVLAAELGVDPGARLRQLERDVLAQVPELDPPAATTPAAPTESAVSPAPPGSVTPAPAEPPAARSPLVGRGDELAVVNGTVDQAIAGGRGLLVVEGEPGAGKTRLLDEATAYATKRGVAVVWGRCLEGDGTPAMWPWLEAVGGLAALLDAAARAEARSGELGALLEPPGDGPVPAALPDAGAQFRLFEQVTAALGRVAGGRPVLVVIDDLQWADPASLRLFDHLAARLPAGAVLAGALRDRAPTPRPELAATLAAASRLPGHRRVGLGPLAAAEVAELVERETGHLPDAAAAAALLVRTGGNPFFVRELSRLLADRDPADDAGVPSGVRDVVRGRMAGLDGDAAALLQIAALVGRDVDLGLLARAAALDVEVCLERLEPVGALGLLTPTPDDPFSFRFAHDLVRESVVETTPPLRATRLHLAIADALDSGVGGGVGTASPERLAHHLWSAGPLAAPERTARALVDAGRRALAKYAYAAAERHLGSAARVARQAGLAELELEALGLHIGVVGMRLGYVSSAVEQLERAEELARGLGNERLAADFLYSRWAGLSQGLQIDRSGALAARLFEEGRASADGVIRAYGYDAWGIHQYDLGNIGAAHRTLAGHPDWRSGRDTPTGGLRLDLHLIHRAMLAQVTALHGDLAGAGEIHAAMEREIDGPYPLLIWGSCVAVIQAQTGDPAAARAVTRRSIATDPQFSFVFLGTFIRVVDGWAAAMLGDDAEAAAAATQGLVDGMVDPPRWSLSLWYTLAAEAWLAAGRPEAAGAALDRAEAAFEAYGQRNCEPLTMLVRATWLRHHGDDDAVRDLLVRARALAVEREAFLYVARIDRFAATLDGVAPA
jgi:DNA-binding SARP family transcriptional activator